jgi:NAD-dependent histone deacetylase SIR2
LDLPYPEAVFDISYFRNNPLPFYTLAHELHPASFRPTVAHSFIRLLSDKGLLLKLFTQNIDGLERKAGIPWSQIVNAHGSFAKQSCLECRTAFPDDLMAQAIEKKEVPHCQRPGCGGLVKPDIVFFGEQLPNEFHLNRSLPMAADLCIIMGTSLSVQPFASLPGFCKEGVPRLLINREQAGSLGSRPDDVLMLEDCDAGVRKLAAALGWSEELKKRWRESNPTANDAASLPQTPLSEHEALEQEVHKLTDEVDHALRLSRSHDERVREQLAASGVPVPTSTASGSANGTKDRWDTDGAMDENIARLNQLTVSGDGESNAPSGLKHVFPHI